VKRTSNLVDKKEKIILKERKELEKGKKYIGELFEDNRSGIRVRNVEARPSIIMDDVEYTINAAKLK
jgi:hypothetical protein